MKKIISIMLTVSMLIMSVLCINAFAAGSKTEPLLGEMAETKSISVEIDGTVVENLDNVTAYAKVVEAEDGTPQMKIAAEGTLLGFLKVKFIVDENGIKAYIPMLFMKVDVTKFLGKDVDLSEYAQSASEIFDYLNSDYIDCLKLASAGEKDVEGYGTVYVEEFAPDVAAIARKAVENGAVTLPDGINLENLTEEQLIAYVAIAGGDTQSIVAMFKSSAEFYYSNDKLVGFKANIVDADGNEQVIESAKILPLKVNSITSNVDDDKFTASGLFIDMTGLVKFIASIIGG